MPTPRTPEWWLALPVAWAWDRDLAADDRAELEAMEAEGRAERWEWPRRPREKAGEVAWCLTPWGAIALGVKVAETPTPEAKRLEVWAGVKRVKGRAWTGTRWTTPGEWDLRGDGSFVDTFRQVAARAVHDAQHWGPEGREERQAVAPREYGEVRGLRLDDLPGRPTEAEGGAVVEALEIDGEPAELWGVVVPRGRAALATRAAGAVEAAEGPVKATRRERRKLKRDKARA
jgi:hypothetical protein